jgi:hypothetical protein
LAGVKFPRRSPHLELLAPHVEDLDVVEGLAFGEGQRDPFLSVPLDHFAAPVLVPQPKAGAVGVPRGAGVEVRRCDTKKQPQGPFRFSLFRLDRTFKRRFSAQKWIDSR